MMRRLRVLAYRLMGLFRRARLERDLAEELESHIAFAADERERSGVGPAEARRQAILAFGGVESTKEAYRDRSGIPIVETTIRDVRYAARILRRNPGFAAVAILTLALGIGGTTAAFTLADAVWLRSLPVTDPDRLVALNAISRRGERQNASYPLFRRLRDNEPALAGVYASLDGTYRLPVTGDQATTPHADARVQLVSGDYFAVLGIVPFIGRVLTSDDDRAEGGHAVAVLSHAFWQQRLFADPAVIGSYLRIKDHPFLVVGITPSGFFGDAVGRAPDIWVPLTMQPTLDGPGSRLDNENIGWLRIMGRLREGVTADQARESLARTLSRLNERPSVELSAARRGLPDFQERHTPAMGIFTAVVVIVLLLACANVASLLLARARARQREIAVRAALGAGRLRLIRQFLTEGTLLAAAGCLLGVLCAWWSARVLLILLSNDGAPIPIDVTPNPRVLAFAAGIAFLTVILFALAPAVLALPDVRSSSLSLTPAKRRWPGLGAGLVAAQVALSLLVLNSAGLFVRTLQNLRGADLGFRHETMIQVEIDSAASGLSPAQGPDISREILDHVSRLPGVMAATAAHSGFGTGISRTCCIVVEGHDHQSGEEREVRTLGVRAGYFRAMAIPLLHGRDFLPHESTADPRRMPKVVIANEEFVRRYVAAGSPVGRRLGWGDDPGNATFVFEIVGVARDATYDDPRQRSRPLLYFPSTAGDVFLIRTSTRDDALISTMRREILAVNPQLVIRSASAVAGDLEHMLARERMLATSSSALGAVAVLLAATGVFGLAALTIRARTREIGLRMALGASQHRVWWSEIRSTLWLCAAGVAVGAPLALGAGRLIRAELFGVSPNDPLTLGVMGALLVMLAVVASLLPARWAASVNPSVALRCE